MGQAPTESYTERMKHTQSTRHDSKGMPRDKNENAQQYSHGAKDGTIWSFTTYITAIPQRFCFKLGYVSSRTYLFSSFLASLLLWMGI